MCECKLYLDPHRAVVPRNYYNFGNINGLTEKQNVKHVQVGVLIIHSDFAVLFSAILTVSFHTCLFC